MKPRIRDTMRATLVLVLAVSGVLTTSASWGLSTQSSQSTVNKSAIRVAPTREEIIAACRKSWQSACVDYGVPNPAQAVDVDPTTGQPTQEGHSAVREREQMIARCLKVWQPSCAELGVPNPNVEPDSTQSTDQPVPDRDPERNAQREAKREAARERQRIITECHRYWQPSCEQFGIRNPEELRQIAEKKREVQTARTLLAEGPIGIAFPEPHRFSTTAFIRSGWPVVIRYEIPAGSTARLTVTPRFRGGAPFSVPLPASADGSPQAYSFVAEVRGSDGGVTVADYEITARSIVNGREVVAPVKILGIGAGEKAVASGLVEGASVGAGSGDMPSSAASRLFKRASFLTAAVATGTAHRVAIDDLSFDPPYIHRPRDNGTIVLTYSYLLRNEWDRVAEDVWQSCPKKSRCILLRPRAPYRPTTQGPARWEWFVNRGTRAGMYQLVVRAWKTCGALANPAAYNQCGNSADWVIGSAGPILVR